MVYKFITRTKGVVIFAISLIALGSFNTFLVTLSLLLLPLDSRAAGANNAATRGMLAMPIFWVSTFLSLVIYICWVIAGAGALHLKEWARHLLRISMSVYIINMMVNIILNIFLAEDALPNIPLKFLLIGITVSLAYYLSVIYFFSHPNVVRQFKYKSREY